MAPPAAIVDLADSGASRPAEHPAVAVLAGIAIRLGVLSFTGAGASGGMEVLAAGFIGGDAL